MDYVSRVTSSTPKRNDPTPACFIPENGHANGKKIVSNEWIQKVNKRFKPLLERDFNELVFNYLVQNLKATIVLSGSLVELVLTYHCEKKKIIQIPYTDSKGNKKNKNLYDCVLNDLIPYAENNLFFGSDFPHLSNLSRVYRNFIHPGRELKDKLDKPKCDLCFISTTEILRKIL